MQIFQVAGFSLGKADIIRRYMSKKKTSAFMAYHDEFVDGLVNIGAKRAGAEVFWNELVAFSEYAFNKSHAAAYAIVAYITAYLKHHYPIEYMCSVLNYSEFEKIPTLISDCKSMGINILAPDINKSDADFTIFDDETILFGLRAIKGIKSQAENLIRMRNERAFLDFKDLLNRINADKRVSISLIYSGALDCFNPNRKSTALLYEELAPKYKRIRDKQKNYENPQSSAKVKQNALIAIDECKQLINSIDYPNVIEDNQLKLNNEYEKLGIFVTGHPVNDFVIPNETVNLYDTKNGEYLVAGVVLDIETRYDKHGNEMATVTFSDNTDVVNITVFSYSWQNYKSILVKGNVVSMTVNCDVKSFFDDEGNEISQKFYTSAKKMNCRLMDKKSPEIVLNVNDYEEWINIFPMLENYIATTGYQILLWNKMFNCLIPTTLIVSKDIEQAGFNLSFI